MSGTASADPIPVSRAAAATVGEPRVAHDVGDLEHRALARRPERDVEQAVGDARMRAGEATARRLLELAVARAAEVDAPPGSRSSSSATRSTAVSSVCETESSAVACTITSSSARVRSSSSASCRARSPVRSACAARTPNVASRVSCSASGSSPAGWNSCSTPSGGPAERQRGRDRAVPREPGDVSARPARFGERTFSATSAPARDRPSASTPHEAAGTKPVVAALPEDRGGRPCDSGGEANDLGRGVLLLQRNRERLAGELERRPRERRDVAADGEGTEDESGLRGAELGGEPLLARRTARRSR